MLSRGKARPPHRWNAESKLSKCRKRNERGPIVGYSIATLDLSIVCPFFCCWKNEEKQIYIPGINLYPFFEDLRPFFLWAGADKDEPKRVSVILGW